MDEIQERALEESLSTINPSWKEGKNNKKASKMANT